MTVIIDKEIERNTTGRLEIIPLIDYTGYDFIYLAKKNISDADEDAIINITPTLDTKNVADLNLTPAQASLIKTETVKVIQIDFSPSKTKDKNFGSYIHSCRAISADKEDAIVIFNGTLTLTQERIKAP